MHGQSLSGKTGAWLKSDHIMRNCGGAIILFSTASNVLLHGHLGPEFQLANAINPPATNRGPRFGGEGDREMSRGHGRRSSLEGFEYCLLQSFDTFLAIGPKYCVLRERMALTPKLIGNDVSLPQDFHYRPILHSS